MLNEVKHPRGVGILRFAQNDKTPRNPEEPFFDCDVVHHRQRPFRQRPINRPAERPINDFLLFVSSF